jgi:hypothetical protein
MVILVLPKFKAKTYQLRDGLVLGGYRRIEGFGTVISTRLSTDLLEQNKNLNNKERLSMLNNCMKTMSMMAPAKQFD